MRVPAGEWSRSQVHDNNTELILHPLDRNILLQSTGDLSNLSISDIDFLVVELLTVWILFDPDDLANPDINFRQIMKIRSCSFLRWILLATFISTLLLLLLLLFLFWLFFGAAIDLFVGGF